MTPTSRSETDERLEFTPPRDVTHIPAIMVHDRIGLGEVVYIFVLGFFAGLAVAVAIRGEVRRGKARA